MKQFMQNLCQAFRRVLGPRQKRGESFVAAELGCAMVQRTIPVAGIAHRNRAAYVKQLSLESKVLLCLEPDNLIDPNAVLVIDYRKHHLGYLPKEVAAVLNEPIKLGQIPQKAEIVSLQTSPCQSNTVLRIALDIPETVADLLPVTSVIDYAFERNKDGKLVMLIECDGDKLDDIKASMESSGHKVERVQESCRQSQSGYLYRWYVLFVEGTDQDAVRSSMIAATRTYPHGEEIEEYAKEFDREKQDLQMSLVEAQNELSSVDSSHKNELSSYEKRIKNERSKVLRSIIPDNICLVQDSWDLFVQQPDHYLAYLYKISLKFPDLQVKGRVHEAPEWFELKHTTSADRVYYKPKGSITDVLISQKTRQDQDFKWMRKN